MSFASEIKSIRIKSFMTQEEFSKSLGVSFASVNRWEAGQSKPRLKTLKSIKQFCIENKLPYEDMEKEWMLLSKI